VGNSTPRLSAELIASTVINGQTSELEDARAKFALLQEKLDELERNKKICETRINAAKSLCDQYTKSDVLRFRGEFWTLHLLLFGER
jgi:hypothetical protein